MPSNVNIVANTAQTIIIIQPKLNNGIKSTTVFLIMASEPKYHGSHSFGGCESSLHHISSYTSNPFCNQCTVNYQQVCNLWGLVVRSSFVYFSCLERSHVLCRRITSESTDPAMVFFTCSHCGESVKKNKVEKHYQTFCSRKAVAVTCVDCCKDFSAETYPAHTKCVSEEEKYSAKGFVPRPSAQKGEYKQKKWQDIIQSLHKNQSSLTSDEQIILKAVVKRENVPRKKSKFQNFLRSCMKNHYNEQAADSLFDKLEALSKEESKTKQDNQQEAENTGAVDDKDEIKENDDCPSQDTQVEEKLSKKERKERRKRAKYEAEMKEIQDNHVTENETGEQDCSQNKHKTGLSGAQNGTSEHTEINEGGKSKKKHKKEEAMTKNGISEDSELAKGGKSKKKQTKDMGVTETGNAEISGSGISKKKRKKGQDGVEDVCQEQPRNKKWKKNGAEEMAEEEVSHTTAGKTKFNWQQVILKVLESKEDKEIPIKRLQKKVLAEFEAMGGGSAADVKMIAKFNKKVHKTPGVFVHKEVAKLSSLH